MVGVIAPRNSMLALFFFWVIFLFCGIVSLNIIVCWVKEAEPLNFTPDAGGDRYPRWPPGWVHMKGYTGLYKLVQKFF